MTARGRDKRDGERGQILAMMVISLLALCALVAVAADVGFFFDYRRRIHSAADAAAMAGAWQVRRERLQGLDPDSTNVRNEGYKASASNGFTKDVDGAQVTVNWPPLSGLYAAGGPGATPSAGSPDFVEAIITQPRPTIFMAILGFQSATVSARAVAGAQDSDGCIYAMNHSARKAINLNGGAIVNASCGVVDNSNDPDALDDSGGACMTATSIAVTGGVGGNTSCVTVPGSTPQTGVPPQPDPLVGRAAPSFSSSCDHGTGTAPLCGQGSIGSGTWDLQPGVYCDGICINSGAQVTFEPGTYILNGGGLKINGGTVNGTGVTFYNTATPGHTYQSVDISGGPTGVLTAPTSGAMEGMLFFQDRTISPSGSARNNTVNGGGTLRLEGALYFPTTQLAFAGNSNPAATYTILVADTIVFTGTSTLNNDFSSLSNRNPFKRVALAE